MGKFSRLLQAKGKDIVIGDETYNIKPLSAKYLGLFMDESGKDKNNEATLNMILVSLQQTDAELTLDDVKELPLKMVTDIVEVIMEVNELSE